MQNNINETMPLKAIVWIIDKQNLKAVPFVLNQTETKMKNCLTNEVFNMKDVKSISRRYAQIYKVEEDLVHIGKIDALTNYLSCGVTLSENLKTYYEIIKKDQNSDKVALAKNLFMKKCVDKLELSRIAQDLSLGVVRLCAKPTEEYFENKKLTKLENAVRNF